MLWPVWVFLMAQTVKNPSAMQDTQVQSLGWEGPLENKMATHSTILAWRIPWTVDYSLVGYSLWGCKESDTTEPLTFMTNVMSGKPRRKCVLRRKSDKPLQVLLEGLGKWGHRHVPWSKHPGDYKQRRQE